MGKQWILKHSTSFGIVGLVVVVILLVSFLIYRLTRPIERRLERNWYVVGTAIIQAVLFLTSMTVGFCQGRTVTQGGQIAILVCYITNANILLSVWLPFSIMALVYGFQSDALEAGFCMLCHILGTCIVYQLITGPAGTHRLFWKAWDAYLVTLLTITYFVSFIYTPRVYRKAEVKDEEDEPV